LAVGRFAGSIVFAFDPLAGAPGFMLPPASRASSYFAGRSKIWTIIQKHVAKRWVFFNRRSRMIRHQKFFSEYFHSLSGFIHTNTPAGKNDEISSDNPWLSVIDFRVSGSSLL
jgi:hypothetical protein